MGKDMPARPRARAREQLGLGLYRSQLAFSPSRPTLRAAGRQLGLADRRAHLMVEVPPRAASELGVDSVDLENYAAEFVREAGVLCSRR